MQAKDWPALRKALWKFVREPLLSDPVQNQKWKEIADGAESNLEIGRKLGTLGKQGQIKVDDDEWTVRWYTLCYSCMHFDALTKLLTILLGHKWESVPELTSSKGKSLLHVDLGCGPGTASWAIVKYLSGHSCVSTIGFDHNRCMVGLAYSMTAHIVASAKWTGNYAFCADRNDFEHKIKERLRSSNSWNAVVVTANAFFSQNSVSDDIVDWTVGLLSNLSGHGVPIFVIGTHPAFKPSRTEKAWQRIAEIPETHRIYERLMSFKTWNPIGYDGESWCKSSFGPQVAHAFRLGDQHK